MLNHVVYSFKIVCQIGRQYLLNKYLAIMKKVVGNREDPVIYVRSSEDIEIT